MSLSRFNLNIFMPISQTSKPDINKIISVLNSGGVMLSPTDTIYGLGCRADNLKAIRQIFKMKQRPLNKPLLTLVSSQKMLKKYYYFNNHQQALYNKLKKQFSGRPLSLVLRHRQILPGLIYSGGATGGVRLTADKLLLRIMRKIKVPLVSTSANLHNELPATDLALIAKILKPRPDIIINGRQLKNRPSRLVDLTDPAQIKILRK